MGKPTQAEQTDPQNEDRGKPAYQEPKVQYPSYQDFSNESPNEPIYNADRGYTEYR